VAADDDDGEIADLPIEDSIDLHAFMPRDIPSVVEEYLWEASAHGFDEVRLIHGRGTGFQRNRVRQVLVQHPVVKAFRDAPATRGGWGATIVDLVVGKER
jgi:dsDNA-specific endonuclease/ATPase MutS2